MICPRHRSPLFPYTTLFRSIRPGRTRGKKGRKRGKGSKGESGFLAALGETFPGRRSEESQEDSTPMKIAAYRVENKARSEETRLNSSHLGISYAVFCLKKKN